MPRKEARRSRLQKALLNPPKDTRHERLKQALQKYHADMAAADKAAADKVDAKQIAAEIAAVLLKFDSAEAKVNEKLAAEIAAAQLKFDAADAKVKRLDQEIAASEQHIADLKFELQQQNRGVAIATLALHSAQSKVDAITQRLTDEQGLEADLVRLCRGEMQRVFETSTDVEK